MMHNPTLLCPSCAASTTRDELGFTHHPDHGDIYTCPLCNIPAHWSDWTEGGTSMDCYLNLTEDDEGWSTGNCDCGEWRCPPCPGPEEVANAWGDHLQGTAAKRVAFAQVRTETP